MAADLYPIAQQGCPGGCGRRVPRDAAACGACRDRLPRRLQDRLAAVWRDRHANPAGCRDAVVAARAWWLEHPTLAPPLLPGPDEG